MKRRTLISAAAALAPWASAVASTSNLPDTTAGAATTLRGTGDLGVVIERARVDITVGTVDDPVRDGHGVKRGVRG